MDEENFQRTLDPIRPDETQQQRELRIMSESPIPYEIYQNWAKKAYPDWNEVQIKGTFFEEYEAMQSGLYDNQWQLWKKKYPNITQEEIHNHLLAGHFIIDDSASFERYSERLKKQEAQREK